MAPRVGSGDRYALAMGELWTELARTLTRLDGIAGEPEHLVDEDVLDALRRLQYSLHLASEQAYGLHPPAGAQTAHAELAASLAGARDATAQIAEAVEELGAEAVDALLHEWRGALFRVRLARLRLAGPPVRPAGRANESLPRGPGVAAPLAALLLALGGALALAVGATVGFTPLWAGGLIAVVGALAAYRP